MGHVYVSMGHVHMDFESFHALLKLLNKIKYNDWPSYLKLDIHNPTLALRSSRATTLKVPHRVDYFPGQCLQSF